MFISNHVLAGALVGRVTRRPFVAFAAGFASHLAMDMVLHWGDEREWDEFVRVARVDGTVGLGLSAAMLATTPGRDRWPVALGISGACLIDMDKPGLHFFGRSPFPAALDRLHARIQWQRPVGALVEAMASGCPVLGSTAGGVVEVMGELGEQWLVGAHDLEGWTQALARMARLTPAERDAAYQEWRDNLAPVVEHAAQAALLIERGDRHVDAQRARICGQRPEPHAAMMGRASCCGHRSHS